MGARRTASAANRKHRGGMTMVFDLRLSYGNSKINKSSRKIFGRLPRYSGYPGPATFSIGGGCRDGWDRYRPHESRLGQPGWVHLIAQGEKAAKTHNQRTPLHRIDMRMGGVAGE